VSISTASVARQDIPLDLLNVQQIVEQACVTFENARLKTSTKGKVPSPNVDPAA
jgi:hypothetical protein